MQTLLEKQSDNHIQARNANPSWSEKQSDHHIQAMQTLLVRKKQSDNHIQAMHGWKFSKMKIRKLNLKARSAWTEGMKRRNWGRKAPEHARGVQGHAPP